MGKQLGSRFESAPNSTVRFSPDAKSLVYDLITPGAGKLDLWMLDIASGNRNRLASDPWILAYHSPVWSPDGARLAYTSAKTGNPAIFFKAVNQIAQEEERWEARDDSFLAAENWTRDGKFLILTERPIRTGKQRVALLPVTGKDGAAPLLEVQGANVDQGQVSSDGRWIAYRSDESGKNEIYITSFPKPTGKLQVSIAGGVTPRWRSDGKELYYLAPDRKLMAVELRETSGSLQAASIRPLFEMLSTTFLTAAGVNQYDVTPDGSRFIVDSTTGETSEPLYLVVNWTAGLKK